MRALRNAFKLQLNILKLKLNSIFASHEKKIPPIFLYCTRYPFS
jgi:hypothetical protein